MRNWAIVYVGNFVGAIGTAALLYAGRQYELGGGLVGEQAVSIAATKTGYGWWQAFVLGMFCNALVCMAVWLCYSARSTADKVLAIIPPIAAFVAAGFEHSVANMYFIPYGLFVESTEAFPDVPDLTWGNFLWGNLVPVTLGNIVGGALMVGAIYWFIYLETAPRARSGRARDRRARTPRAPARGAPPRAPRTSARGCAPCLRERRGSRSR